MKDVLVPDIGDFKDVEVIEILVKPGDTVAKEQSLVSLESDKATMEIPSPEAGVVKELKVKVGDKVSEGSLLLMLEPGGAAPAAAEKAAEAKKPAAPKQARQAPPRPPLRCRHARRAGAAGTQGRGDLAAACEPVDPQVRARTGRGSRARAGQRTEGPDPEGGRAGLREGRAGRQAGVRPPPRRAARCPSTCPPGPTSISPSSARSNRSRCRASRSCRGPTCTATGYRSRTSRSATTRTSPISRPSARARPSRPRRRASSSRCSPS